MSIRARTGLSVALGLPLGGSATSVYLVSIFPILLTMDRDGGLVAVLYDLKEYIDTGSSGTISPRGECMDAAGSTRNVTGA